MLTESHSALCLQDVTVRRGARVVVDGVDLVARSGEIVAIVGPNGAGKSTLLRAIAGTLPFEGRIEVQGHAARHMDARERARVLTLVPQESGLDAALSVEEVVAQGRFPHRSLLGAPGAADREAVRQAMEHADVRSLRERPYNQLSHGEKRRVILARALATCAPIVLLDEPTASLDVAHTLSLFGLLRARAAAGLTVLIVLHQLQEVAMVADRVLLLSGGRVHALGPIAEVITPENVRAVYDVELVPRAGFGYERRMHS